MYQELFDYMHAQHDVLMLESDMQEVIDICGRIIEADQQRQAHEGNLQAAIDLGLVDDDEPEEDNFKACADCDGHDACYDFGCAIEHGVPVNEFPQS